MALDTSKRVRNTEAALLCQVFGLLLVLFEVWADGQLFFRHTKLLSLFAWSPHTSGWKEVSFDRRTGGGHGPFRGLDALFALKNYSSWPGNRSQPGYRPAREAPRRVD